MAGDNPQLSCQRQCDTPLTPTYELHLNSDLQVKQWHLISTHMQMVLFKVFNRPIYDNLGIIKFHLHSIVSWVLLNKGLVLQS